jgi:hypothetical protein
VFCRPAGIRRQKVREMKKNEKKLLLFPPPKPGPVDNTVIVQIGVSRFAIHFEIEDLPPLLPPPPPELLVLKQPGKKRKSVE